MKRFLMALLLAGWIACTPKYESGKTLCSTAGECPSGFVCAPGNVCITGGIPGHGGGGAGGGRTGGTTGSTGGSGGTCAASAADTPCGACGKTYCCAELSACQANSACLSLLACLNGCAGDTTCQSTCETTYSAGLTDLLDAAICADDYCSDLCGSGGSGGSGGSVTGGSGGTKTGGSGGSGGSITGGSGGTKTGGSGGSVTGGSGGAGGSGSGGATGAVKAKFCHGYTSGSSAVTLTLTLNGTAFTAATGNCAPVNGCATVATGTAVPFSVVNGSTTLSSGTINLAPVAGNETLMSFFLDSSNTLNVRSSEAVGICSGGTGTSGTLAKFCNYLQRNSADITLTLTVGSTTISALSGTCAPIAACSSISGGTNIAITLKEGTSSVYSGTLSSIAAGSNMLFTAEMDESASTPTPTVKGASYATGLCSSAAAAAQAAPIDLEPLASTAAAAMVPDGTVDVPAGLYHALRGPRK